MAMDFFESQVTARRRTWLLIVLFVLAVLATIVMVYLAVSGIVLLQGARSDRGLGPSALLHPALLAAVGSSTIAVVGLGSGYKLMQLRAGGAVVAESLGGRLVRPGTVDLAERRLLNVVEEMAIASGLPVPVVYLLKGERSINAFAAGHQPAEAVVGVTRGALERLSRDELQGVVAHEFSHILNGDMRINTRLIGWLHGILVVGLLGTVLLRSIRVPVRSRRGGGAGAIIAIGLALTVIGYVGVFFGKLVKAAVSRQREYLADAAAVQFTRNPEGLAGALKQIGARGSRLGSARAAEASHMFFAQGIGVWLDALFATHPPLPARIRRLDPDWDGTYPRRDETREPPRREEEESAVGRPPIEMGRAGLGGAGLEGAGIGTAVAQIGALTELHLRHAEQIVGDLPAEIRVAAREPYAARAVLCALLLDGDETIRRQQREQLRSIDERLAALTDGIADPVHAIPAAARLPLLELLMPALRSLSPAQYADLRRALKALGGADQRTSLFEWMLERVVEQDLDPLFNERPPPVVQYYGLQRLTTQCAVLLSTLARVGHAEPGTIERAFRDGARRLPLAGLSLLSAERCTLGALDEALSPLVTVSPPLKRAVLEACAAAVASDRQVTVREGEILRALAAALGCPMPPLLPGQPLI